MLLKSFFTPAVSRLTLRQPIQRLSTRLTISPLSKPLSTISRNTFLPHRLPQAPIPFARIGLGRLPQSLRFAHTQGEASQITLSQLISQYGLVALVAYGVVSAVVFWSIYFAIRLAGVDAEWMLEKLEPVKKLFGDPNDPSKESKQEYPWTKTLKIINDKISPYIDPLVFSVTFLTTKILFPLEIAAVVAITRRYARYSRVNRGHPSVREALHQHRDRKRRHVKQ